MKPFVLTHNGEQSVALFLTPGEARDLRLLGLRGVARIKREVADYYRIPRRSMEGKSRERAYAHPRQVAMYLARELEHKSYPWIGQCFGGRDHTTVLHAAMQIPQRMRVDKQLANDVAEIRRRIGA